MVEKRLIWVGSVLEDLRAFPPSARRFAGYQLRRVQEGLMPSDWKPMKGIGPGVNEIRIHTGREYRVLYVASFPEAVYVLHAFEKRTRQTARADIELARARLRELRAFRKEIRERQMTIRVRHSTTNVYRDLGFSPEEAENLKARSDLMIQLTKIIEDRGLTQAAAAKVLGVTQPRISDLMRGKIDRFSIDSLVEMLGHAGLRVTFVLKPRRKVA